MKVWVLIVLWNTWNEVLGVYSSWEKAMQAKLNAIKNEGGASSLPANIYIIERILDEGLKEEE